MSARPRTAEEMAALPVGPEFGAEERVIEGRLVKIPVARPTVSFWSEDDDALGYADREGQLWTIGKYADGDWFRRRV